MKILQVVPYFPPAYVFGGPVKVTYQIALELVKRKHDVVVYTSDAKDFGSRLGTNPVKAINGIMVHYLRNLFFMPVKKLKLFITPRLVVQAKEEVKKFDIVHLHEYRSFQNIVTAHYAKKYGVPYVLQAHGSLPRIMAKQKLKMIYDVFFGYRLLREASKVIALNRMEAEQYKAMGVSEEKIAIIPNGVDLSEYGSLQPQGSFKKKFGIGADEKVVLYVGRIHESKGLDLLAQAFKIVLDTVSNVKLVVVGPDDGYAAEFSRLISDLRIEEKVLLLGFVEKDDKIAAFIDSDVFVTPFFSGFPVTFLEACLAGCPIVTASNELDWIHNSVGYVTEYSSDALARAVVSVLQDEHLHRKFQNNCKHVIKNFEISKTIRQLEKIYNEAPSHTRC